MCILKCFIEKQPCKIIFLLLNGIKIKPDTDVVCMYFNSNLGCTYHRKCFKDEVLSIDLFCN